MQRHTLKAEKRDVIGKHVKKIRKSGLLPIGLYGKDIKSLSLQVPVKEFNKTYSLAGKTGLVDLKVGEEVYPSLIKNVQLHPVSDIPLHAEFHKVNLKEKIRANVPTELVGESPAVTNQTGLLLQTLNEVEVEALPTNLPETIKVDVTELEQIDDQITVGELPKVANVEILTPPEEVIVKIVSAVSQEVQKEAEAQAAAAAAAEAAAIPAAESGAQAAPTGETVTAEKPEEAKG